MSECHITQQLEPPSVQVVDIVKFKPVRGASLICTKNECQCTYFTGNLRTVVRYTPTPSEQLLSNGWQNKMI